MNSKEGVQATRGGDRLWRDAQHRDGRRVAPSGISIFVGLAEEGCFGKWSAQTRVSPFF
jgi:hypothetical protein